MLTASRYYREDQRAADAEAAIQFSNQLAYENFQSLISALDHLSTGAANSLAEIYDLVVRGHLPAFREGLAKWLSDNDLPLTPAPLDKETLERARNAAWALQSNHLGLYDFYFEQVSND